MCSRDITPAPSTTACTVPLLPSPSSTEGISLARTSFLSTKTMQKTHFLLKKLTLHPSLKIIRYRELRGGVTAREARISVIGAKIRSMMSLTT